MYYFTLTLVSYPTILLCTLSFQLANDNEVKVRQIMWIRSIREDGKNLPDFLIKNEEIENTGMMTGFKNVTKS